MFPGDRADRERETRLTAVAEPAGPSQPLKAHGRLVPDLTLLMFQRYADRGARKLRKNMVVNAGGDVAESFFWRLARAALCCPVARKSMKTW